MANMSYVRHENTLRDLSDVWDRWEDGPDNEFERDARQELVWLVKEMAEALEYGDLYGDIPTEEYDDDYQDQEDDDEEDNQ